MPVASSHRRFMALAAMALSVAGALGAEEPPPDKAKALARERWKNHFGELAAIQSPRLRNWLGDCALYRATVYNPLSVVAGRPTFLHTLVLRPEGPAFVEKDEDAAALLAAHAKPVADPAAVLDLALAFGELRNYRIETRPRVGGEGPPRSEDWAIVVQEANGAWSVACTFLVDPNIAACRRYALAVTREGRLTVQPGKTVSAGGGYR